jgi:hypothetical protein
MRSLLYTYSQQLLGENNTMILPKHKDSLNSTCIYAQF